ncbi:hypothetical protein FB451DRAFT_1189510 [Mycena latifolia]|nr:hypothetical protein FB451DRAFT_1189510 [Mycena latifolia]
MSRAASGASRPGSGRHRPLQSFCEIKGELLLKEVRDLELVEALRGAIVSRLIDTTEVQQAERDASTAFRTWRLCLQEVLSSAYPREINPPSREEEESVQRCAEDGRKESTKVLNWECESERSWDVKLGLLVAKEPTGDVSEWNGREITEISLAFWPALVTEEVVEGRACIGDGHLGLDETIQKHSRIMGLRAELWRVTANFFLQTLAFIRWPNSVSKRVNIKLQWRTHKAKPSEKGISSLQMKWSKLADQAASDQRLRFSVDETYPIPIPGNQMEKGAIDNIEENQCASTQRSLPQQELPKT